MKILLINPPYFEETYKNSKHKIAVIQYPPLNLATLAGYVMARGHLVEILDGDMHSDFSNEIIFKRINAFQPDLIGFTMTSAQYNETRRIVPAIKTRYPNIKCIVGGPHASALPEATLNECGFDAAVLGEGEVVLARIADHASWDSIPNLCYRQGSKILCTTRDRQPLPMDELPLPAWQLFDLKQYRSTRIMSRKTSVGPIETSRGCPYQCIYCNKNIFGNKFRFKSPRRVVDEMETMLKFGFEEIHIIDDNFSTNLDRAKQVCEEIIRRKLKLIWSPWNGLRVDRVDLELLKLMKRAGCYRVHIGIESGNQEILDLNKKGTRIEQIRQAAKWIKAAKMEAFGCFMLGLLGDSPETMQQTIDFAKSLQLDYAKFTIMTPMPGTELFDYLDNRNLLKHKDWSKFNFSSTAEELYHHPDLSWEIITKTYNQAYREFYLRPGFIFRRIFHNFSIRRLMNDISGFLKIKW